MRFLSIVSRLASITFIPNSKVRGEEVIEWRSSERSKLVVGRAANGALTLLITGGVGGIEAGEEEVRVD